MDYTQLRPKIILNRIIRHQNVRERMTSHLRERDKLLKALNEQYDFADPDGTFGIGKKSEINTEYAVKYNQIDKKYNELYSNERKKDVVIDIETLSIWEYLLFDNISTEATEYLLRIAEKHKNKNWYDFITVRAEGEIGRWRKEYNIGEIMKRIKHEKNDFSYRTVRCRKNLNFSRFNLSAQKAIFDFKSKYIRSLNETLKSLEA